LRHLISPASSYVVKVRWRMFWEKEEQIGSPCVQCIPTFCVFIRFPPVTSLV
jgi:hypothetical protein